MIPLPEGVLVLPLVSHIDVRGSLTEIFRSSWKPCPQPVQWNLIRSSPRTVRGVHLHPTHWDYWILVSGRAAVGLSDLRKESKTFRQGWTIPADGSQLQAIVIPPGVAHGFMFLEESMHIYSVSHYWDPADELGCAWNDPELKIAWPELGGKPLLSKKDAEAAPLRDLLKTFLPSPAR